MLRLRSIACLLTVLLLLAPQVRADDTTPTDAAATDAAAIEFFEKQVRPILVARCHECHAGDEHKGNLRLDSRAAVLAGGDTGPAIVPGDPDESLLIDAVRYGDIYQMPPDSQLPEAEVRTLTEWVRRGAAWGVESAAAAAPATKEFDLAERSAHWAFQPLAESEPPEVGAAGWVRTPVDRFIFRKLEAAEIAPAKSADRRTLLRRVTFDLTGLPPTPAEIAAFENDTSPSAYETVVNRLLASPRYGERWARHWLDLVRYAETHGHEFDFEIPGAWRYRDYVIRALNADLPYNQFLTEHLAGDLLRRPRRNPEDGTNESVIATAWWFLGEAVHSPVDVRADEATRIDNQIDVFSKAFLGLTVACARCHDHKFDAISTKDYYALAGYLQSSRYQQAAIEPEDFLAGEIAELRAIRAQREEAARQFVRHEVQPRLEQFAESLSALDTSTAASDKPSTDRLLNPWFELTKLAEYAGEDQFARRRVELLGELETKLAARKSAPAALDFGGQGFAAWSATGQAFDGFPAAPLTWVFSEQDAAAPRLLARKTAHSGLVSSKLHGVLRSPTFEITGPTLWYRLYGSGGRVRLVIDGLQLIRNPIYGGLEFPPGGDKPHWHRQDLSKWIGHRGYIELVDDGDGFLALEQVVFADDTPPVTPNRHVVALLDDPGVTSPARLAEKYEQTLRQAVDNWLADPAGPHAADSAALVAWLFEQDIVDPNNLLAARRALAESFAALDEQQRAVEERITPPRTVSAILDGTAENERVFIRGNHKTLGDEVPRRFLEVFGGHQQPVPEVGSGRLELARQLVSPDCPLVPRVIVNRLWHHHFGAGLVRSPDDFGVMGQEPTHGELLDFLARELVANDWSLKHLHRLMVLSNTYRMASTVDPVADTADPQNKLWHRMAVRRIEAESIRDAVLFVSGRLDETMYGPSVMPHLTDFMVGRGRPNESGPLDGQGRRSIYLGVRRNFLSPLFLAFDYPTPFTTIGRRGTSNVPAQALTLMNNPLVIEQAGAWADRALAEQADPAARIRSMYEQAFARQPEPAELDAALAFVEADDREAWAHLAHVLLNVKEFIYIP